MYIFGINIYCFRLLEVVVRFVVEGGVIILVVLLFVGGVTLLGVLLLLLFGVTLLGVLLFDIIVPLRVLDLTLGVVGLLSLGSKFRCGI